MKTAEAIVEVEAEDRSGIGGRGGSRGGTGSRDSYVPNDLNCISM